MQKFLQTLFSALIPVLIEKVFKPIADWIVESTKAAKKKIVNRKSIKKFKDAKTKDDARDAGNDLP